MQRINAIVGPTELFIVPQQDEHVIAYRWNKKVSALQLRADSVKIETAKIVARLKSRTA